MTTNNVSGHDRICAILREVYIKKNRDYGDSYAKSLTEHGLIAGVVRMDDKMNRLTSLTKVENALVEDESIEDTLMDLANYAIMTVIWMRDREEVPKKPNSAIYQSPFPLNEKQIRELSERTMPLTHHVMDHISADGYPEKWENPEKFTVSMPKNHGRIWFTDDLGVRITPTDFKIESGKLNEDDFKKVMSKPSPIDAIIKSLNKDKDPKKEVLREINMEQLEIFETLRGAHPFASNLQLLSLLDEFKKMDDHSKQNYLEHCRNFKSPLYRNSQNCCPKKNSECPKKVEEEDDSGNLD